MKNDGEEKVLTPGDILQEYKLLQKELEDAAKRTQHEEASKKIWRFITLAFLVVCLYNTKTKTVWYPDLDDGGIRAVVHSDWWGLKRQEFHPVWTKSAENDYEQWCIKWPDGKWHTFEAYDADGETAWISFPPKK
jgi:hypothetical protein